MKKEVFKSGTWTDSAGRVRTWTNADLDKMVAKFNPADREIPMVAGHPKTDSPAYGWVKKVWREGNGLIAEFKEVVAEMQTAIEKRMFKNTSIAVNPDGSLRHIGFLGGTQPAVPGLGNIQFEDNPEIALIEFSELPNDSDYPTIDGDYFSSNPDGMVIQSLIFSKAANPTDKTVETWIAKNPQFRMPFGTRETRNNFEVSQKAAGDFDSASFRIIKFTDGINAVIGKIQQSKKGNTMDLEQALNKIKELETELSDSKAKITETEARATDAESKFSAEEKAHTETKAGIEKNRIDALTASENEFVDGLIKDRKLKPADKALTLITLEKLRDADEIEFEDSEGKPAKIAAQKQYMDKLSEVAAFVSDSEDFTDGVEANKDGKLSKLAKARASEKGIELSAATAEILEENPTLN